MIIGYKRFPKDLNGSSQGDLEISVAIPGMNDTFEKWDSLEADEMTHHFISVIVAVKNEEKYIEKCLLSLINQNYPHDSYRIVVVDGMSTDQTINIVDRYRLIYGDFIRLYENPEEWQAAGRNLAIKKEESSDLIAYIDGHCFAEKDWLKNLYNALLDSDKKVAGVGSVITSPPDESNFGNAINKVFSTLLGAAGTSYIGKKEKTIVETAPFVLYRREALLKVGLYDEEMRYGEDYSLNYELRKAGYQLLVNPHSIVYSGVISSLHYDHS